MSTRAAGRVGMCIKIGPTAVDFNQLINKLEEEQRVLILLTPNYGIFGRLKGYYAYLSYSDEEASRIKNQTGRTTTS